MILPGRAGEYRTSGANVRSFLPKPLPPDPALSLDAKLIEALSRADRALARLDGATLILPNPDFFVYAFMRQEALLSSQIEGTQASLDDVLEYESGAQGTIKTDDITEVVNYLDAMKWGIEQLDHLPVCLRLVRGLHARLLASGRGSNKGPGEFRHDQNWIGDPGCTIEEATFVPPPPAEMQEALNDWERFLNENIEFPPLIKCALAHAQFETIHPFLDGNGRLGRMIITFLLCSEKVLRKPILYLSLFFKQHRREYYEHLQDIRDRGNWEAWVLFFLRGVSMTSKNALIAAQRIIQLREEVLERVHRELRSNHAPVLAEILFQRPYVTINAVKTYLGTSFPTASSLIDRFVELGYLEQVLGRRRERVFAFRPYLDVLHSQVDTLDGVVDGEDFLGEETRPPVNLIIPTE